MILLLDNYDSFVHNLARYFRLLRCETVIVRSDEVDAERCRRLSPRGIVISPGPNRPEQAGASIEVIRKLGADVPVLGVCLGHQAIGVAWGAAVVTCEPMHGMSSRVKHNGQGIFAQCPDPMSVGRYHSLAIDPSSVGDDLEVTAHAEDGTIMGIRHRLYPTFGVQFHPESVLSDHGMKTIESFVAIVNSPQQVDVR